MSGAMLCDQARLALKRQIEYGKTSRKVSPFHFFTPRFNYLQIPIESGSCLYKASLVLIDQLSFEAGMSLPENMIIKSDSLEGEAARMNDGFNQEAGYLAMQNFLAHHRRNGSPTAVFVTCDIQAVGAIKAVKEAGLRIPEDIAIIGFDDIELSEYAGLTTVRQPLAEMGREAVERMMALPQSASFTKLSPNSTGLRVTTDARGISLADYDNDGFPDLFVGGAQKYLLYRNLGNRKFEIVTAAAGVSSRLDGWGGAAGDLNNDGYQDLLITNWQDECLQTFINNGGANNSLKVGLTGGKCNR